MANLLMFGSTEASPAMRHEVPVAIGDPFLLSELDGRPAVLTNALELVEQGLSRRAQLEVVARAVPRLGIRAATVPGAFPVAIADRLRADGVELTVDDALVDARHRVKAGAELDGVRAAQAAAHAATRRAAELLARSAPDADGDLRLNGERLLAERVREQLRAVCAEHGCTCPADMIVGSVRSGYGHDPGSGPLPAGLPIQVDVFPRTDGADDPITVDGRGSGRVLAGFGAISGGGGTSRLLMDYPQRQRDQILDYLFKPGYGASLQILKVEIGSDTDSTNGAEPSQMRTPTRVDCNRGYEWQLGRTAQVSDLG